VPQEARINYAVMYLGLAGFLAIMSYDPRTCWPATRCSTRTIFAGVGNIIKNEVLFRIRVHPLSTVGALPPAKLRELVANRRADTVSISSNGRRPMC
jgi:hypothetical protein